MRLDFQSAILNVLLLWMLTAPHEFAHAWVATKLGDDTPRLQGRLTLNPLAHADWLGTLILPFLTSLLLGGFLGWGKPVYTNNNKLRGGLNGLALVALAGPASNIAMAVILAVVARLAAGFAPALFRFALTGVVLSLYLAIFNLIPVPPLDGSKLLLAMRVPVAVYREIARFGFMALILMVSYWGIGQTINHWSLQGARMIYQALR
jgi:Zn-dependent protease